MYFHKAIAVALESSLLSCLLPCSYVLFPTDEDSSLEIDDDDCDDNADEALPPHKKQRLGMFLISEEMGLSLASHLD